MMIEKIKKFREYLDYIEEHYNNVQKAWALVREKCADFDFVKDKNLSIQIEEAVKQHDLSKLSEQEFTQYRQFFYPTTTEEKNVDLFNTAWEHHKANNDHHWQTWTQFGCDEKKLIALIHNIIDLVAMGFKFGDTAQEYYEKNKDRILLPQWAIIRMYDIFKRIYGNN